MFQAPTPARGSISSETVGLDEAPRIFSDEGRLSRGQAKSGEPSALPPSWDAYRGVNLDFGPEVSSGNGKHEVSREELGLDELAAPPPHENPDERNIYRHSSLEDREYQGASQHSRDQPEIGKEESRLARCLTQLYMYSYLVLLSILGVLARVGLQALTLYPGALIPNTDLWANFAGCLVIGFLREDRMLFRRYWRKAQKDLGKDRHTLGSHGTPSPHSSPQEADTEAIKKAYQTSRAGLPGYIGLTVGFCGSLTSFSSICRDAFLAISNDIETNSTATNFVTSQARSRSGGYSVMAVMAVLLLETGLSVIALKIGAHLAVAVEHMLRNVAFNKSVGRTMDPAAVILGWGVWIGAIVLTIFSPTESWRGDVLFALVFAPLGCILRFRLSIHMNRLIGSFPLGTFAANVFGTAILGMSYDLQHSSVMRSVIGCQVLQGIEDGFCGALTTVSTWVLELDTLRLKHAYSYGSCTVFIAIGCIVAIIGPLRWTEGFVTPECTV